MNDSNVLGPISQKDFSIKMKSCLKHDLKVASRIPMIIHILIY